MPNNSSKFIKIKPLYWVFLLLSISSFTTNAQPYHDSYEKYNYDKVRTYYSQALNYSGQAYHRIVQFQRTGLTSNSNFSKSVFYDPVRFLNCYVEQKLNLSDATFKLSLNLSGSRFAAGIDFTKTHLPRVLILKNVELPESIDLTRIIPTEEACWIDLRGTNMSKVKLDYRHFRLFFADRFNREYASDAEIKRVYKDLLAQQKKLGFVEGYEKLSKEFARVSAKGTYKRDWPIIYPSDQEKPTHEYTEESVNPIANSPKSSQGSFKKDKKGFSSTMKASVLIASLVVGAVAYSIWRTNQIPKVVVSPEAKIAQQTQKVVLSLPNYFKQELVPLKEVYQTVHRGDKLWRHYQIPKDVLAESNEFWQAYEQLLSEVKAVKA